MSDQLTDFEGDEDEEVMFSDLPSDNGPSEIEDSTAGFDPQGYFALLDLNELLGNEAASMNSTPDSGVGQPTDCNPTFINVIQPDEVYPPDPPGGLRLVEITVVDQNESLLPSTTPRRMNPPGEPRRFGWRLRDSSATTAKPEDTSSNQFKCNENFLLPSLMAEEMEKRAKDENPDKAKFAMDLMLSTFAQLGLTKEDKPKD